MLYETENYTLTVGPSEDFKRPVYRVVNKHTSVVEHESPIYGIAVRAMNDIDEMYKNAHVKEDQLDFAFPSDNETTPIN